MEGHMLALQSASPGEPRGVDTASQPTRGGIQTTGGNDFHMGAEERGPHLGTTAAGGPTAAPWPDEGSRGVEPSLGGGMSHGSTISQHNTSTRPPNMEDHPSEVRGDSDRDSANEEDEGLQSADEDELSNGRDNGGRSIEAERLEDIPDLIELRPEKTIRLPPHHRVWIPCRAPPGCLPSVALLTDDEGLQHQFKRKRGLSVRPTVNYIKKGRCTSWWKMYPTRPSDSTPRTYWPMASQWRSQRSTGQGADTLTFRCCPSYNRKWTKTRAYSQRTKRTGPRMMSWLRGARIAGGTPAKE